MHWGYDLKHFAEFKFFIRLYADSGIREAGTFGRQ